MIQPMQEDIYKRDYDYEIPDELIAKYPLKNRIDSKILLHKNMKLFVGF